MKKKRFWSKIALITFIVSIFGITANTPVMAAAPAISNFTVERFGYSNEYHISYNYSDFVNASIVITIKKADNTAAGGSSDSNNWNSSSKSFSLNQVGSGTTNLNWYAPDFNQDQTLTFAITGLDGGTITAPPVTLTYTVSPDFNPEVSNLNVAKKSGSQTEYEITFDHEDFVMTPNPEATYLVMELMKMSSNGSGTVVGKWDSIGAAGYTNAFGGLYLNGTAKVTWNSANSGDGNYKVRLVHKDAPLGAILQTLEKDFVVDSNPAPTTEINNLQVNPDPYDPTEGDISFSYSVSNILNNTITKVTVLNPSNTQVISWNVTNADVGDAITWDAPTSLADGTYTLKVEGWNGSTALTTKTKTFVVDKDTTPTPSTKCAGFTDVPANHPDCTAITWAKSTGAFTGNPDGTLRLSDNFQRDQSAKVILEVLNKYNGQTNYCEGVKPFSDVSLSSWAANYICRGKDLSMITGYLAGPNAGKFLPAANVSHYEFLALALRPLNETMPSNSSVSYNDVPTGQWFSGYAKYAKDNNLFPGSNLYGTKATTRLEVIQVLYKLHQLGKI